MISSYKKTRIIIKKLTYGPNDAFRVVWARSPHHTSRNFLLSRPVHATMASADVATRRPAGWPQTSTWLVGGRVLVMVAVAVLWCGIGGVTWWL